MNTATQQIGMDAIEAIPNRIKVYVFIFTFLALMVDAADMMFLAYSLNSLKVEFGLSQTQAGSLGTFTLIGMFVGGTLGGWACDHYGRVRTIVWSIVVFSVGTASLALATGYLSFAAIRFVSAIGIGSIYLSCNILMSEYVSKKHRSTILAILIISWSIGYICASLLAGWIIPNWGWRMLFATAIVPVVLSVIMWRFVPEPPSWIANRKARLQRAEQVGAPAERSSFRMLVDNKGVLSVFVFWMFTTTFFQFGYYGVTNWLPSYLESDLNMDFKKMTGYMIGTFVAMMLGKVIGGVLADRIGRRTVYALGSIGTAAMIPLLVLYHSPENVAWLLWGFGLLFGIPVSVLGTYMTESFPSKIRGFAMGWSYNAGRIGGALAPITIGFLADQLNNMGLSFLVLGAALCLTGLIPGLFIKSNLYDPSRE